MKHILIGLLILNITQYSTTVLANPYPQPQIFPELSSFLAGLFSAASHAIAVAANISSAIIGQTEQVAVGAISSHIPPPAAGAATAKSLLETPVGLLGSRLQYRSGVISATPGLVRNVLDLVRGELRNVSNSDPTNAPMRLLEISNLLHNSTKSIVNDLLEVSNNLSGNTAKLDLIDSLIRSVATLIRSTTTSLGMLLTALHTLLVTLPTPSQPTTDQSKSIGHQQSLLNGVLNSTGELVTGSADPLINILDVATKLITSTLQGKVQINNDILNASAALLNVTADTQLAMMDTTSTLILDISDAMLDNPNDVARLVQTLLKVSAADIRNLLKSTDALLKAVLITDSRVLEDLLIATDNIINTREAAKEELMNVIINLAENMLAVPTNVDQ